MHTTNEYYIRIWCLRDWQDRRTYSWYLQTKDEKTLASSREYETFVEAGQAAYRMVCIFHHGGFPCIWDKDVRRFMK